MRKGVYMTIERKLQLYRKQEGKCGICGTGMMFNQTMNVDHYIPVSKGGTHKKHNLQLTHKDCNTKKGSKLLPQRAGHIRAFEDECYSGKIDFEKLRIENSRQSKV